MMLLIGVSSGFTIADAFAAKQKCNSGLRNNGYLELLMGWHLSVVQIVDRIVLPILRRHINLHPGNTVLPMQLLLKQIV